MQQYLVKIGDFILPTPSTYEATTSDFVDAGRNVQGVTIGSVVRSDVAKISMSWKFLTVEEWSQILKQFNPKYGGNFYRDVTFFNQVTGDYEKRQFYVSDRKASLFRQNPQTGQVLGYTGPQLSLVEA